MPAFSYNLLGACNKANCPESCGYAFVEDKAVDDYQPLDKCSVCGCSLASHVKKAAPPVPTGTEAEADPDLERAAPKSTNKVNSAAFAGATASTLFGSRGGKTTEPDVYADSPFRRISKTREEARRKAAEGKPISQAEGVNGPDAEKRRFDPAQQKVVDNFKTKTGAPPRHEKRAKKLSKDTLKEDVVVEKLDDIHVVLIPWVQAAHRGEIRRPSEAMYNILGRPDNNFNTIIQVPATASSNEVEKKIQAKFEAFLPCSDTNSGGANPDIEEDSPHVLHLMDVVAQGRGSASMLVVNQWFQKGQADAATIKKHFNRSQPSGMLPAQMAYCIYVTLSKDYADLPVDEPRVPTPPEVEKRQTRGRKRRASQSPIRKTKTKKPKISENIPQDDITTLPKQKKADSKASHTALLIPADILKAKRLVTNTYSGADRTRIGDGYAGSGQWYTTSLIPPYAAFSSLIGNFQGLFTSVEKTSTLKENADLLVEMISTDCTYVEAFAPFAALASWIRGDPDDDEREPHPAGNPDFVKTFKLGTQGISLAVEAGVVMGNLLHVVSCLPGMSTARYRDLCDVYEYLKVFSTNLVAVLEFFFKHVERRYWFPKAGFRQLESVVGMNAILMNDHSVHATRNSLIHKALLKLHDMVSGDHIPASAIKEHIIHSFGSHDDATRISFDTIAYGAFGMDLVLKIMRFFVEKRVIHRQYDDIFSVLGKFALALSWKLQKFLERPHYYNQRVPFGVKPSDARRNPCTGNFQPLNNPVMVDDSIPQPPGEVDSEWFRTMIIPNTYSTRFFFTDETPKAGPVPKSPVPAATPISPLLIKAQEFAGQHHVWNNLIRRLRTDFAHPDTAVRVKFELDVQPNIAATPRENKKKQWAAAQRAYHPDKNITLGVTWVQVCTQLNCAINRTYES